MKTIYLIGVLALLPLVLMAQEAAVVYQPPFDFPAVFSGNFGEIRTNHFHAGLDFKTQGATGKPIKAQANGYISRIRVNTGSGYVLNVTYDNGYYLIYRHLSKFTPEIDARVKQWQYGHEQWEVDITPEPTEYPVKTGQLLGYSGNTGYSFGPHLHLDAVEIKTDEFVDPLPFFQHAVKDHTAPVAEGFMVFPQHGQGVVDGQVGKKTYPLQSNALQQTITAWGVIGVGLKAYDHMEGASNRYGVKLLVLEVDGEEVFRSNISRFAESEHRYINSWTEGQYMKSFIEPGNKLSMLQASNGNRGLLTIDEERPYRLVYTLTDGFGNTSKVKLTITGKQQEIPATADDDRMVFHWNEVNIFQQPGFDLVVPRGRLYDNLYLDYQVSKTTAGPAFTYQLSSKTVALHDDAELSIGLTQQPVADTEKYYVAGVNSKGKRYSLGGKYQDGSMKAKVREIGTFTVGIDTVPPVVTPVNPQRWGRSATVTLQVKDEHTGISSYRGTIDGQYALFGKYNSVNNHIVCYLDPEHLQKGGKHQLEFTATDECGNTVTEYFNFTW
ncbi:MAG: M23 family metallopeptidase [Bacteroidaceae bacterium]|nr:M23 family metallopeptidase [Bacteroidaceae bacterium]